MISILSYNSHDHFLRINLTILFLAIRKLRCTKLKSQYNEQVIKPELPTRQSDARAHPVNDNAREIHINTRGFGKKINGALFHSE